MGWWDDSQKPLDAVKLSLGSFPQHLLSASPFIVGHAALEWIFAGAKVMLLPGDEDDWSIAEKAGFYLLSGIKDDADFAFYDGFIARG